MSYEVGTRLNDKDVANYAAAVESALVDGEHLSAVFWAHGLKPTKNAIVITNGRLIGVNKTNLGTATRVLCDELRASDLASATVNRSRLGVTKLVVTLRDGRRRDYVEVQKDDADAVERHLAALVSSPHSLASALTPQADQRANPVAARAEAATTRPAGALAAQDEQRASADVLAPAPTGPTGPRARLHAKANQLLDKNLEPDEQVLVVINGASSQAVIGTDRRAFVYKKGFLAGATFGGTHLVGLP